VVIISQDPYHGAEQAHGICFSTKGKKSRRAFKNIYKEIEAEYGIEMPRHGDLTARDGQKSQSLYFPAPTFPAIFLVAKKFQIVSLALIASLVLPTSFSLIYCWPPGQVLPPSFTL